MDAIINCAGELDHQHCMFDTNVALTNDLLKAFGNTAIKFIQIGSSSETGPIEGPRSEKSFCRPSNLYEATKLAATNLCLGYVAQYLDVCIARPFTVYGPQDKPRKMLPTLWRAFCDHSQFDCYPGGHDWLHVDDFVQGIIDLLDAPPAVTKGQLYHFGTGVSTSNEQIVHLFEAAAGALNVTYHGTKLRPYDVMDWRADSIKARSMLCWSPKITIQEGITRLVMEQWFKEDQG